MSRLLDLKESLNKAISWAVALLISFWVGFFVVLRALQFLGGPISRDFWMKVSIGAVGPLLTILLGSFPAIIYLVIAARKQRASEQNLEDQVERGIEDAYFRAVQLLGNPETALGGVAAVEQEVDNAVSRAGRTADPVIKERERSRAQRGIANLCAYLALPHAERDVGEGEGGARRVMRSLVWKTIRRHLQKNAQVSWQGFEYEIRGGVIDVGELGEVEFLEGTKLHLYDVLISDYFFLGYSLVGKGGEIKMFRCVIDKTVNKVGQQYDGQLINLNGMRVEAGGNVALHFDGRRGVSTEQNRADLAKVLDSPSRLGLEGFKCEADGSAIYRIQDGDEQNIADLLQVTPV